MHCWYRKQNSLDWYDNRWQSSSWFRWSTLNVLQSHSILHTLTYLFNKNGQFKGQPLASASINVIQIWKMLAVSRHVIYHNMVFVVHLFSLWSGLCRISYPWTCASDFAFVGCPHYSPFVLFFRAFPFCIHLSGFSVTLFCTPAVFRVRAFISAAHSPPL